MPRPKKEKITESEPPKNKQVKTAHTIKYYMMLLSIGALGIGVAMFVIYFFTLDQVLGGCGIILIFAGILGFRYSRHRQEPITVKRIGNQKDSDINIDANCINFYPASDGKQQSMLFEYVENPDGFPWPFDGIQGGGDYYVNRMVNGQLVPLVLTDCRLMDPLEYGQGVLRLPCHQKLAEQKPKLLQKLKTALLVLAIAIVWLLILTTTGG